MFKLLNNPKTSSYYELKKNILSSNFPWFWSSTSIENYNIESSDYLNVPFYAHTFLSRPNTRSERCPMPESNLLGLVSSSILEILEYNHTYVNSFLRICANCVHPQEKVFKSIPHVDHNFPHQNLIIYLTDAGGKIFIGSDCHDPKEDDIICFDGQIHYIQTPKKERRIVLVATFI